MDAIDEITVSYKPHVPPIIDVDDIEEAAIEAHQTLPALGNRPYPSRSEQLDRHSAPVLRTPFFLTEVIVDRSPFERETPGISYIHNTPRPLVESSNHNPYDNAFTSNMNSTSSPVFPAYKNTLPEEMKQKRIVRDTANVIRSFRINCLQLLDSIPLFVVNIIYVFVVIGWMISGRTLFFT